MVRLPGLTLVIYSSDKELGVTKNHRFDLTLYLNINLSYVMDPAINGDFIPAGDGGGNPTQNHNRKLNSEREGSHFLNCSEGSGKDDRETCHISAASFLESAANLLILIFGI